MANFNNIKQEIDQNVNTNGQQAITGAILNRTLKDMIDEVDEKKQDALIAGSGISIDSENVISATGGSGSYSAGEGISIDSENVISTDFNEVQEKLVSGENIRTVNGEPLLGSGDIQIQGTNYSAGNGISIDASEVISVEPGEIAGTGLDTEIDEHGESRLKVDYNSVQTKLESGVNIKTVNGNSLLGSGDLVISGGNQLWQSGSGTNSLLAPASSAAGATASGNGALNAGNGSSAATGELSTAFGHDSKANGRYSFVAGNNSTAAGESSVAIGRSLNARSESEVAVGKYNSSHTYSSAAPWTTRFSVGNGTSAINTSNSLEIRDNDKVMVKGIGGYAGSGNDSASNSLQEVVNGKQDILVSGVNIKTINGSSVLGSGDLVISGGSALSAGDGIDIDSNDAINAKLGNGLQLDSNNNIEIDPYVVASQSDLSAYLRNDASGQIQNFLDGTGDTELKIVDGSDEDYVKLGAYETTGEAPHIEIFENGSGDTKFFYDHLERGSQISIDYPTNSGTLALTSDIPSYSAGDGINISNNTISVDASDLAGNGLRVDANGALEVVGGTPGSYSAGDGIDIQNGVISVDETYLDGKYLPLEGGVLQNDSISTGLTIKSPNGDHNLYAHAGDSGYIGIEYNKTLTNPSDGEVKQLQIWDERIDLLRWNSSGNAYRADSLYFPSKKTGTLALDTDLQGKQDTLVSGTNIKTINGNSLLGSGNIVISGGGGLWTSGTGTNSLLSPEAASSGATAPGEGALNAGHFATNSSNYQSIANGKYSASFGTNNYVWGENATGFGANNTVNGKNAFAVGDTNITAGISSFAGGQNSRASGTASLAFNGQATATKAIAINGAASGIASTGIGATSNAGADNSTAIGYFATTVGNADYSVSLGYGTQTYNEGETALGNYNTVYSADTYNSPREQSFFTIGNGTASAARSNVLEIKKNNDLYLDGVGGFTGNNSNTAGIKPLQTVLNEKQETLVSGTNIKTVNGNSLLGSGDLVISGGTSYSAGDGINISNNTISVDASDLNGTGLSVGNNKLQVEWNEAPGYIAGSGLQDDGNGQLEVDTTTIQEKLVSGTNLKTVNGNSLLGSGNIVISGGSTLGSGQGIDIDSNDDINVKIEQGGGLDFNASDELKINPDEVLAPLTGFAAVELNTDDPTSPYLDVNYGVLAGSLAGSGLQVDSTDGTTLEVDYSTIAPSLAGNGLQVDSTDGTTLEVDSATVASDLSGYFLPLTGGMLQADPNDAETLLDVSAPDDSSAISISADTIDAKLALSADIDNAGISDGDTFRTVLTNTGEIQVSAKTVNPLDPTDITPTAYTLVLPQKNDTIATLSDIQGGGSSYSAGSGISIDANNVISNTAPGLWTSGTGNMSLLSPAAKTYGNANGIFAVSAGVDTKAEGISSFAMGSTSRAYGNQSFAGGSGSETGYTSACSFAFGQNANAKSAQSLVFGSYSSAETNSAYSIVLGNNAISSAQSGNAIGLAARAKNTRETAFGPFNNSINSGTTAEKTSYTIGNGTADNARSNLIEAKQNNDIYVVGVGGFDGTNASQALSLQTVINSKQNQLVSGVDVKTINGQSIVGGGNLVISGGSGLWTSGTGTDSMISAGGVASGLSTATNTGSISAGYDTDATGLYSAAFGAQALASGDYSFAASNGSASGDYSASFGTSGSTADYAFSAGNGSTAAAVSSMALGRGVHTTSGNTGEGALGIYNYSEAGLVFSIGCGTADNSRENAVAIDSNGNIFIKGLGGYTGTSISGATSLQDFLNNLNNS